MATKVRMPKLSDTMEEGVILRWTRKEGEEVAPGQIIAEVETEKAIMEVEANEKGILRKILVPEGETALVGAPIAIISEPDKDIEALPLEVEGTSFVAPEPKEVEEMEASEATPPRVPGVRIKASPLSRRIATDQGIDLSQVQGTGPMGRIIKRDIEAYAAQARIAGVTLTPKATPPSEANYEEISLSKMRKAIARKMAESKGTTPHVYLTAEIDMKKAMELRSSLNQLREDVKITFNDLIIKATALALTKVPEVNAAFVGKGIRLYKRVHIGVAVAVEDGVVTPVIRDCDKKGLGQISKEAKEQAARAREGKLQPEAYTCATFTVTNLGMYGVESFSVPIHPSEGAVLAVGAIISKPVVREDQIVIRPRMQVTLSCDQRAIDGTAGARFLTELRQILENPLHLMM